MRRIAYLCAVLVMAPGLLVTGSGERPARARESKRPNVLLIVTDDHRGGLEAMPGLRRRFVHRGRSYPNFFATTPQCCPSRVSILTGKYAHNHGVVNNRATQNVDPRTMLQYYLQRKGYRTAIFGKFLNSWGPHASPPYFNKWATFTQKPGRSYDDPVYNVNGDLDRVPGYYADSLGAFATKFLRQSSDQADKRPWMMYLAPLAAHSPFKPERRYRLAEVSRWNGNPAVFERDRTDKPEFVTRQDKTFEYGSNRRRRQLRTLMSLDDLIGRVMRTMKRLNERNTIALFASDNGMMWSEHGVAMKHIPYQQSVNVPFFVRWPGRIRRGSEDDRLVGNIDITPTVLDAARAEPDDAHFDGKSLLDRSWIRNRILLEFFGPRRTFPVDPWAATRTDTYQYTEYYDANGDVTFREYYDLAVDPWELENRYEDDDEFNDPTVAETEAMHQLLESDRSCAEETCP